MAVLSCLNQAKQENISLQGNSYYNFINAIKSPATRKAYTNSLRRYMNHLKISEPDDLLTNSQYPKLIESQLVKYIMSLRESGVSYSTIKVLTASLYTYYELNDVTINRRRVAKYLPEMTKVVRDEAYTMEAIAQALQNADQRMRMIILILASTGCRIGALPGLVLRDLTKIPEYDIYRITFYQGTRNEYYTITTREAASTGIDNYLNYRQRSGEKLAFNSSTNRWEPDNAPLIRIQFDINDGLQVRSPQPMKLDGLRMALTYHMIKSGLRQFEHITENANVKRVRKLVPLANGFRKYVISTFIEAGLNHEIRELIVVSWSITQRISIQMPKKV